MTILKVEDDESPLCPVMESDLVFQLVYLLMVEECLSSGVHLRDTEGRVLCYFDQAVLAMEKGRLQRIGAGSNMHSYAGAWEGGEYG